MENPNKTSLISRKKVLITVVTYPLPSRSYDELVCTAGILEDGSWIRIYPVPLQFLKGMRENGMEKSYKYSWIELDLKKRTDDFRPESHSPENYNFSDFVVHKRIDTKHNWKVRKHFCLKNVYTNLNTLIEDSKNPKNVSLATFKPAKIIDFIIEKDDREWKPEWKEQMNQLQFNFEENSKSKPRIAIPKVPYKFYYQFIDDKGKISKPMIEDWEIGALYWNCLRNSNGDEDEALQKIKERYFDNFALTKDIYLFLGTNKKWHIRRGKNPFVIVGVFYPPKEKVTQFDLFE